MKLKKILPSILLDILYIVFIVLFLYYIQHTFGGFNEYELPLFCAFLLIVVFCVWFIFKPLNYIVACFISFLYSLYLIAQNIYYSAFNQYCRINMALSLLEEAAATKDSIKEFILLEHYLPLIILLLVTILWIILYFVWIRKQLKEKEASLMLRISIKMSALILLIFISNYHEEYLERINETRNQEDAFLLNKTDFYIYDTIPNTNQFKEIFGLTPFAYRDIELYFSKDLLSQEDRQHIDDFMSQRPLHKDNEMTGIFAGKNVLFIQAESYNQVILDEELTPTIYKMYSEGIRIDNFNTPAIPGSTSDSEFMANTSLIPYSLDGASCYRYPNNTYNTTLANLFKENGYATAAYHNCFKEFYNRGIIFPNFGYDEFLSNTELKENKELTDFEVADVLKWIVTADYPYMGYWVTFSGHQPYEYGSVAVNEKDVLKIKEKYPDLDEEYVSFIAKNMDLDRAIEELMNVLERAGKLDDFVFVFFGDHVVKGLDFSKDSNYYKQTGKEYRLSDTYTDLYIYNSETEAYQYTKTATLLDFLPTIANLWGFDYNEKEVLGRDIFDETYSGFYFSEWEMWKTDHYYYDFINDEFYPFGDYDLEKAKEEMAYYTELKEVSKKILNLDYFKE